MKIHRIYYPFTAKIGDLIKIDGNKVHYLSKVLRLKVGELFNLFNRSHKEYTVKILEIKKKHIRVELVDSVQAIDQSLLKIRLVQAISKGDRMDYSIQKATELGVDSIQPIVSEFCEVRLRGVRLEKKLSHWQAIAISACEQCFRVDIPKILPVLTINEYCDNAQKGVFLEPFEKYSISQVAEKKWKNFDVAIGPEGGWSNTDLSLLKATELIPIQLGQRILRTETMAPAILAAIHSLWGDFV